MDYIPITILDFTAFFFVFIAYIFLILGWKQKFSINSKIFLNLLIFLYALLFLENLLPLYKLGENLGPIIIYYELMGPVIWFLFFYTLIQEITKKEIKESEEKAIQAKNVAEFYKDLFTHDMNNILSNILASTELSSLYVEDQQKVEELKKMLKLSKDQAKLAANLVSNIRKLSNLEEGQITMVPTDAVVILNKAIEYILKSFQLRDIDIKIDNSYEKVIVQGNELLIDVFENILNNAVKYNFNSRIDINILFSKTQVDRMVYIKIEFRDNGIGIPDSNKEWIFQRAGKTNISGKGMGIGLSLVKKILTSYNGKIWVENVVQGDYKKGSNFVVTIPFVEEIFQLHK